MFANDLRQFGDFTEGTPVPSFLNNIDNYSITEKLLNVTFGTHYNNHLHLSCLNTSRKSKMAVYLLPRTDRMASPFNTVCGHVYALETKVLPWNLVNFCVTLCGGGEKTTY